MQRRPGNGRRDGSQNDDEARTTGDNGTRLSGIRPLAHEPDERPSREDLNYGRSIFAIPVPLPRVLRPRPRR